MKQIKDKNGKEIKIGSRVCIHLPESSTSGVLNYLDDGELGVVINDNYQFTLTEILARGKVLTVMDEEDIDIDVDFDEIADVEVDGGFDGENDDSCPDGACKI